MCVEGFKVIVKWKKRMSDKIPEKRTTGTTQRMA